MGCSSSSAKAAGPARLQLYGAPASMNAVGPALLISALGVGEMIPTVPGPATMTPEFVAINPFQQIPALRDGDFSLAESGAILRYVAEAYAPDLYPQDPKMRGVVDWAIERFSSALYKDAIACIYPAFGYGSAPDDLEAAAKTCVANLEEFTKVFLASKFIGGDKLSIADYKVAPFFFCYEHGGLQEKNKVMCPERVKQFNKDFSEACKSSGLLKIAGGYALKEMLDSKTKPCEMLAGSGFSGGAGGSAADKKTAGKCMIYGAPPSMNSMGPALLVTAAGCGELKVTLPGPATNTPEFLAINPFHQVPTLSDGDYGLAESSAILHYVAASYAPDTYPKDAKKRGFIDWAIDRFGSSLSKDAVACVYPLLGFAEAPTDQEAAGKKCSANLDEFAKVFLKSKFIGGDSLSIADYRVAPFFFSFAHAAVQSKSKVACPARIVQFNEDFALACKSAGMLTAAGGYALKEMLDAKL